MGAWALFKVVLWYLSADPSRATPCGLSSTVPETSWRLSPSSTGKATSTPTSSPATFSGVLTTSASSSSTSASASKRGTRWACRWGLKVSKSGVEYWVLTRSLHPLLQDVKYIQTDGYRAPEAELQNSLAQAGVEVDSGCTAAVDMCSLGIVLLEMFSGMKLKETVRSQKWKVRQRSARGGLPILI